MTINKKYSVMIVDDDKHIRNFVFDALTGEGFDTCFASNCSEAKKILSKQKIDLLVTDLKMPGENGMYLIKYFRQISNGGAVIIITLIQIKI